MNALLTTGESRFYPHITDEMLTLAAGDEDHLTILRALGLKSVMMVALTARERILGALTLISAESGRHFTDEDLAMAEDLGRRAGVAVDNARLYQQAQDALRLREEFLSIASHELKTPLTALQLQMQILDRATAEGRLADLPQQRVERMLDGARRQMRRLSKLVNDLLDVSRIAAGRTELEKSRFDLVELTNQVIDRFREESVMARVPISLTSDQPVIGSWDRFQIDQVITNLLSNAVKYGEGKPVEVRVESDGERARLNVFDRGLGIAPEHLSLVFERFERVSLSQSYGGLGLGLYISRQIVEAHGGTIRAESTAGEGTAFIVELPLEA